MLHSKLLSSNAQTPFNATIVTHSGVFHADDVLASAMLRLLYPSARIIRTRDAQLLKEHAGRPNTFLLDVGGQYRQELGLFDHHQPEGAGYRNPVKEEWPYATAGLVWRNFGREVVRHLHPDLNAPGVAEVVQYLDDSVLRYVDAIDCGVRLQHSGLSLSAIIGSFNPGFADAPDDSAFELATQLAQVLLTNLIRRQAGKVVSRSVVRAAAAMDQGSILLLEACIPWSDVVAYEMPKVLTVVYPVGPAGAPTQWQVRTAAEPNGVPRMLLPMTWAGRERSAIVMATGVADAVFCHRSRHLAGAATQEGALQLARIALAAAGDLAQAA